MPLVNRFLTLLLCSLLAGCSDAPSDRQADTSVDTVKSSAVVGVLTAEPGSSSVRLAWNGVVDAQSYRLYHAAARGVDASTAERFEIYGNTGMVHTGLIPGSEHHYRVSAVTMTGEGPLSDELSVILPSLSAPKASDVGPY